VSSQIRRFLLFCQVSLAVFSRDQCLRYLFWVRVFQVGKGFGRTDKNASIEGFIQLLFSWGMKDELPSVCSVKETAFHVYCKPGAGYGIHPHVKQLIVENLGKTQSGGFVSN